jgi:serine/threonine protein kinase
MELHALQPGYLLAEYRIEKLLGEGGFGLTYLAFDTHLEKKVAIKEYMPSDFCVRQNSTTIVAKSEGAKTDYDWGLNAFITEAKTLAKFDDTNIVRIYRFFKKNGTAYLVMEYCEGGCLSKRFSESKPMSEKQVRELLSPIMNGLQLVHDGGVLHRDIKPDNMMFRGDGTPVLIDFGAARQLVVSKSKPITALLTPGYAPIEQYGSKADRLGPWTDIYSLAAVAYSCLTGKVPPDASDRVIEDEIESLAHSPTASSFLKSLDKALSVQSINRPQNLGDWYAEWGNEAHGRKKSKPQSAPGLDDFRELDDMIEMAGADSVITSNEMKMLLNKATQLKLDNTKAQSYIIQKVQQHGWKIESEQAPYRTENINSSTDNFGDIFEDTISQDSKKGGDLRYSHELTLEESFKGQLVNIRIPTLVGCDTCNRVGSEKNLRPKNCVTCHGQGRTEITKTLSVKIPAGVVTGDRIRLSGQGDAGVNGAETGDLFVEIDLLPHDVFSVKDHDLYADVYLNDKNLKVTQSFTFDALGGRLNVKLPKGYMEGQQIRLVGQGLYFGTGKNQWGDLFLSVYPGKAPETASPVLIEVEANSPALANGVLQENIGLETQGGVLTPLAEKGTSLQSGVSQIFSTAEDNQHTVSIKLFRGNATTVAEATSLGTFDISNIVPAKQGVPQIEVALLAKDNDFYLRVSDEGGAALTVSSENRAETQSAESNGSSLDGYMPVQEFANKKGLAAEKVIAMIKDGFYHGKKKDLDWYVSVSELSGEQAVPDNKNENIGFRWWQIWGWLGLTLGNVVIFGALMQEIEIFVVMVMLNTVLSSMILRFNKYAFLVATILTLNPIILIVNGIYLKHRWHHPKVNKS